MIYRRMYIIEPEVVSGWHSYLPFSSIVYTMSCSQLEND